MPTQRKSRVQVLAALLERGEEDIRRGRTMPMREVFEELRRSRKLIKRRRR